MMEQDYRREMDQVTLSPQQKERIIQAMGREQTRRRAAPLRLLLAAALLCKCRKPDPYITLYGSQDPREP